jgi:hypothetical protein
VPKRVCYLHVGPHKTGTSSIQWFLQEYRGKLLEYGYFVPESGTLHGAHHAIVRKLCGQELPEHQESAAVKFCHALGETPCKAVVISSEALAGLLRKGECAKAFFSRIRELNFEPKLILFPRNQAQLINSHYAQVVKGFRRSESFEAFVLQAMQRSIFRYSLFIDMAKTFDVELVVRPFSTQSIISGVVPEFLQSIGIDSSQFADLDIRRNETAGPFTISVARCLSRVISSSGRQLKWLQAERCKKKLAAYLKEKGWEDTAYCGLTTTLARRIEEEWRSDNDAFAQRVWGRSWGEILAADIGQKFTPNDFEMSAPDASTERRLRQAVRDMTPTVQEILVDRTLSIESPWNDLQQRAGWTARAYDAFKPSKL